MLCNSLEEKKSPAEASFLHDLGDVVMFWFCLYVDT